MRAVWWSELRATAALALPIVAGELCYMGQNMVDVLLAGHLDAHVLAAVSVGANVWGLALMTAIGISYALPPAVAQLDGAGRRRDAGAVFRQALWLGLAVGLVLMAAVRWGGPELVRLSGVATSLQADAAAFLRAISLGAPALTLFLSCRGFSEGLSRPGPSMVLGLVGLLLLIPIGYGLMYGRFGMPMLGARGCGLATALVIWLQLGIFAAILGWSRRYRGTGWSAGRRGPDPRAIGRLLRVGLPMTLSQVLESSLFTVSGLVIGGFGEAAAAGNQIAFSVAGVSFMVPLGVALATTVRVGNAAGRGERAASRRAGTCGMLLAMALQAGSSTLLLLVPAAIAGLYTADATVIGRAAALLPLAGIFQFSDALQVTSIGALRGLKDVRVPVAITLVAYWGVGMPIGLWLAYRCAMQAPGMWIGLIAGLTAAAALLCWRFVRVTRPPLATAGAWQWQHGAE